MSQQIKPEFKYLNSISSLIQLLYKIVSNFKAVGNADN